MTTNNPKMLYLRQIYLCLIANLFTRGLSNDLLKHSSYWLLVILSGFICYKLDELEDESEIGFSGNIDEWKERTTSYQPTILDYTTAPFYILLDFLDTLWRCFKPSKLAHLGYLIKFWFNYYPIDSNYSLELIYWELGNLQKNMESEEIVYHQHKRAREIKIFRECIRREIEDDYGCWNGKHFVDYRSGKKSIKLNQLKAKENSDMLSHYFKKMNRWWI